MPSLLLNRLSATVPSRVVASFLGGGVNYPTGSITFVTSSKTTGSYGTGIAVPSGLQDGDVLIAVADGLASAPPAGWTLRDSYGVNNFGLYWTRKAGAVTDHVGDGVIAAFRNVVPAGDPFDALSNLQVTTLSSGTMLVFVPAAYAEDNSAASASFTNFSGSALRVATGYNPGDDGSGFAKATVVVYDAFGAPGTTLPESFTRILKGDIIEATTNRFGALRPNGPAAFSSGAMAVSVSGSPVSPAIPTGIVNNDVLICFIPQGTAPTTMPAGWTAFSTDLPAFWKRTTGAETSPTVTSNSIYFGAQIVAFRGCTTVGNPIEVTGSSAVSSGGTLTMPGITTLTANSLMVALVYPEAFADSPNSSPDAIFSSGPAQTRIVSFDSAIQDNGDATFSAFGLKIFVSGKGLAGATANEVVFTSTSSFIRSRGKLFNLKAA